MKYTVTVWNDSAEPWRTEITGFNNALQVAIMFARYAKACLNTLQITLHRHHDNKTATVGYWGVDEWKEGRQLW